MKSLNTNRWVKLKYPRDTPRISRKKLWYDRSEWRQDPQVNLEGGKQMIDDALSNQRDQGNMPPANYNDSRHLMNRAGRVALKKM